MTLTSNRNAQNTLEFNSFPFYYRTGERHRFGNKDFVLIVSSHSLVFGYPSINNQFSVGNYATIWITLRLSFAIKILKTKIIKCQKLFWEKIYCFIKTRNFTLYFSKAFSVVFYLQMKFTYVYSSPKKNHLLNLFENNEVDFINKSSLH